MRRDQKFHAFACAAILAAVVPSDAQEDRWFSGLARSADKERSSASAFDSSLLEPSAPGSAWAAAISAPYSTDGATGSIALDPAATLQLTSSAVSVSAFRWKVGAGAAASLSRESSAAPLVLQAGPLLALETEFRFAGPSSLAGSPSERLRAIELQGKLLENERTALDRVLEAAGFAARSAAARADAEYAKAKAAYLEKEARRIEIELGDGRLSMASYAEARDAWERARLESENFSQNAEALGRQAWAASRSPIPANAAAFSASGLYAVGAAVAALLAGPDPAAGAVAEAAAPWDLRIAELDVQALAEAPRLSAALELKAFPNAGGSALLPSADGTLGFALPLGRSSAARAEKAAALGALRREAADSAASFAVLRFAEAKRALALAKERIATLEALASERKTRADSWARLLSAGTANVLDSLAAAASLAEARAALDREKAGYFLSAVTAFSVSGLRCSDLVGAPNAAPAKP